MDKYGLKASMDLHTGPPQHLQITSTTKFTGPGSQNGYDNSGRRGEIRWVSGDYPLERANIDRCLSIASPYCTPITEPWQSWTWCAPHSPPGSPTASSAFPPSTALVSSTSRTSADPGTTSPCMGLLVCKTSIQRPTTLSENTLHLKM